MGTCGGKKTSKDKTANKMKQQDQSTNQNGVKQLQEQNIITNRNDQEGDITQQVQPISTKHETQNIQKEEQPSQINHDKNNIQEDYSKLSEVLPKNGIHTTTTPIIQVSKKKVQDDDFAKHHLEV